MKISFKFLPLALFVFMSAQAFGIDRYQNTMRTEPLPKREVIKETAKEKASDMQEEAVKTQQSSTIREEPARKSCVTKHGFRYYENSRGYMECVNSSREKTKKEK